MTAGDRSRQRDVLLPVLSEQSIKTAGINVERTRQGFLELEKFVRSARSGKRPVDGILRSILAAPVALSRTSRLGNALDR